MALDLLAVGHVARDVSDGGFALGGTVTYASLTALNMGLNPAIVTSAGPELDLSRMLPGVRVYRVPSATTTTFRNTFEEGSRTQAVQDVAASISLVHVPEEARSARLVMLGPLVGELEADLAQGFPEAVVMASLQGWLRRWDDLGRVTSAPWHGVDVLPHLDAAIVSEDDVADPRLIGEWEQLLPVLIVTRGPAGAELHCGERRHHVDAFAADEVDPTGAGDVFGAAFLIRFGETQNPVESAVFASAAASFCVEARGTSGIPTRAQVEAKIAAR